MKRGILAAAVAIGALTTTGWYAAEGPAAAAPGSPVATGENGAALREALQAARQAAAQARASVTSATGRTRAAPLARAVMIVVEARRTSITTAIPPATAPSGIRWKSS